MPPGATGFYAGESVTITGTGAYDGTYTIAAVNSSGTSQLAAPTFTITTSAPGLGTVTTGTVASPIGVLEAQALGIVGSDNLGAGPTGELAAKTYVFTTNGANSSIGTASRPIQSNANSSTGSVTLVAGSGGAYFVDWGNAITIGTGSSTNAAVATGAGNVVVSTANANGHSLTVNGIVSTGSGNLVLGADDNLTINAGSVIGGAADPLGETFSGTVYLGANRDQGDTGTLLDQGTITTTNSTIYNAGSQSQGAVLLEDYSNAGTHNGDLTLGNITVGDGGSITLTTDPTIGIFDVPATAGSADIIEGIGSPVLNAGTTGIVNLIAQEQSGTTADDFGGVGEDGSPLLVSAGIVLVTNDTAADVTNGAANNSVFISDAIAGNFSVVASGPVAGVINLTDTDTIATGLTIGGPTSTAGGGTITLTDTSGTNITVSAPLGSTGSGAIAIDAGTADAIFTSPQTFYSNDPVTVTAGDPEFQSGSSLIFSGGSMTDSNGVQIDSGADLAWGATTTGTASAPVAVAGTVAPTGMTTGTLNLTTDSLSLGSTAILGVNASSTSNYSAVNVSGAVTLDANTALQVYVIGHNLNAGDQITILTASSVSWSGAPATVTAINNSNYVFSVTVSAGSVTLTVHLNQTATTTSVTSNPVGPITQGDSVNFTAGITGSPNVGTVSFYFDFGQSDQLQIGGDVPVTGGTATSDSTTALPAGSDLITAIYSGGVGFAGSQGTTTITVNQATTTSVTSDPVGPITQGDAVDFTATISGNPSVGSVSFYFDFGQSDQVQIGGDVPVTGGSATSDSTTALPPGSDLITAIYSGGVGFAGSQGTTTITVNQTTTTSVTSDPVGPITQGDAVDFTATISGNPSVGSVSFYFDFGQSDQLQIGGDVPVTSGSATSDSTTALPAGSDLITAIYSGGVGFAGSQGTTTITVNQTTTTSVTSNPVGPITQGDAVDFTATINGNPSVGTVSFYFDFGQSDQLQIGGDVPVSSGTATSDSTTALPVGSDLITAIYSGGVGFAGSQGTTTITVNQATTTSVTSDPVGPITQGDAVDFTATISGNPSVGTVSFYFDFGQSDQVQIGGDVPVTGGSATSDSTTALPPGSDLITAIYSGGTGFAGSLGTTTITVNQTTTTSVTSDPVGPITQGDAVDFTATISGNPSVGTVSFYFDFGQSDQLQIGGDVPVSSGTATSDSTTALPPGSDLITAIYSGGTGFAGSLGTTTITVNQTTTTSVTSDPVGPITQGDAVDFTATISGNPSVGTVSFYFDFGQSDQVQIGGDVPVTGGTATSDSTTALPPGSDLITAIYSGGTGFAGSQGTTTITVNQTTTTSVTSDPVGPITQGDAVDFTATISGNPSVGSVSFYFDFGQSDQVQIGGDVPVTGGSATSDSTTALPPGSDLITAIYSGGTGFAGSLGTTTITVNQTTTTSVTSDPVGPITQGDAVDFTATISGNPSVGTVSFYFDFGQSDQFQIGGDVPVSSGTATSDSTTALPPGSDLITAIYSGGVGFAGSQGTTTITVNQTTTTSVMSDPVGPITQGDAVDFTATISGNPSVGTVSFYFDFGQSDQLQIGGDVPVTSGSATSDSTTALPAGSDLITAIYSGGTGFAGSQGTTTITVNQTTTTSVTSDPVGPITQGDAVDFTATISGNPSVGTVSFYFDFGQSDQLQIGGAVPVTSGSATSDSTTALPPGSDLITAIYSGGVGFAGSQGTTTITVNQTTTTSVTSDPVGPITQGDAVDFTATISGNPSVGSVSFYFDFGQSDQLQIGGDVPVTSGSATSDSTTALPAGSDLITAIYSGGVGFAGSQGTTTITVNQTTTTSVTSNPVGPITQGDSVNFTADITGSPSVGSVSFYFDFGQSDQLQIGGDVPVTSGSATSDSTTALPAGSDLITAIYSGGTGFAGSQGTTTITVNQTTTTSVTSDPVGPITQGDAVDFTATISGNPSVGTVSFYFDFGQSDQLQIGGAVPVTSGSATSDSTTALPPGSDLITAIYSGGVGFAGSQGTTTITVNQTTTTSVTSDPVGPITQGDAVDFTATISGNPSVGSVSFYFDFGQSDQLQIGGDVPVTSGSATSDSTTALPAGSDLITAIYSGGVGFAGSQGTTTITVNQTTTTSVTSNPVGPITQGDAVDFTATISGNPSVGTVSFYFDFGQSDQLQIGGDVPVTSGSATSDSTTALPPGSDLITAIYSGGTGFAGSQGTTTITVNQTTTTSVMSDPVGPITQGDAVDFTATISGNPSVGTVSFYFDFGQSDQLQIGGDVPVTSGSATSDSTTALPPGSDLITAIYSGGTGFAGSQGTTTITVNQTTTTSVMSDPVGPITQGDAVDFTATISGNPSVGTVSFYFDFGQSDQLQIGGDVPVTSGSATSDSTTALPAGSDLITAIYSGGTGFAGSQGTTTITVNQTTTTSVTSDPVGPITQGDAVDFTATISGNPSVGTVSFYFDFGQSDQLQIGGAVPVTSGTAISDSTTTLPAGSDLITAIYSGGTGFAGSQGTTTITVNQTTTTSVTSDPVGPITQGDAVDFTATINGNPSVGTVSFYFDFGQSDQLQIGGDVPVTSGSATSDSTTALPAGSDLITAIYSGGVGFAGSQGTTTITVNQTTTTSVTSNPVGPITQGDAVDFTATISGNPSVGTVSFYFDFGQSDQLQIGGDVPVTSGSATSDSTTALPPGSDLITAIYSGGTGFAGSQGTTTITVNQTTTTSVMSDPVGPITQGDAVDFTATISGNPSVGTVSFYFDFGQSDQLQIGGDVPVTSGSATSDSTTALPAGSDLITAIYSGGVGFAGSQGTTTITVNQTTTTSVTSNPVGPITQGDAVDFTATISGNPSVGTVSFYFDFGQSDQLQIGGAVPVTSGTAISDSTTTLPAGSDLITAIYSGGTGFAGSQGTTTITVNQTTTTSVTSDPVGPITQGDAVDFTATINGNPSVGTVSFYFDFGQSDQLQIGGDVPVTSGSATSDSTTALPAGSDLITAIYSGGVGFAGSQGTTTITVNQTTTTSVTSNPVGPITQGDAVDFTATISGNPSVGTVSFYFDFGQSDQLQIGGDVPVTSGSATSDSTTALPAGSDLITAIYSGGVGFAGSQGTTTITVNQTTTTSVTSNPVGPITQGDAVDFTATISGNPSVGTVSFYFDFGQSDQLQIGGDVPVTSGSATSDSTTALPGGSDLITAIYSGGVGFAGSQGTTTITVNQTTTTSVTSNPVGPITQGDAVDFTATISGNPSVGTVSFYFDFGQSDQLQIGGDVPVTSGTATSDSTTALPAGSDLITAIYSGGVGFAGSQGTTTITVNQTTTTSVTSNPVGPITQGDAVDFTATISGNPSVGTVSFYFDFGQSDQLQIGGDVPVTSGSATSDSTTALPAGSDLITAIYSGGVGFAGSQGTLLIQVNSAPPPPPTITSVVINQDISALYNAAGQPSPGVQRSMVEDIVYTFSEPVNFSSDPNVFSIAVAAGWTGTVPGTVEWAPVAGSGDTQWEVDFGVNPDATGSQAGALNSIANGVYTITLNDPASITSVSDTQALSLAPSGIGSATQSFYRLFGDINGDQVVNPGDNNRFKAAITTYNPAFDYNQDGIVNPGDNNKFKADLTVDFTEFTPTI